MTMLPNHALQRTAAGRGLGSGGHNSTGAATCESCHSIDLAWLRRRGMLTSGRYSTLTWS